MSHRRPKIKIALGIAVPVLLLAGVFVFAYSRFGFSLHYAARGQIATTTVTVTTTTPPGPPPVRHLPTPSPLRAIYMTQCVAGLPSFRNKLIKLIDDTELNAVVVDLKDYSGTVAFPSTSTTTDLAGKGCRAPDFKNLVETLHDHDIYVIGRLTTFQDPVYTRAFPEQAVQSAAAASAGRPAPWKDHKGLSFVDVAAKPFWDYIVSLARQAHDEFGVDEINFDYIRYPSDGNMADARYLNTGKTHAENLEDFFAYVTSSLRTLKPNTYNLVPILSADLFGMTATNYDDLNIGQVLERTMPYFDYVDPMVYPSHYPSGFNGWANVNAHPYDIVHFSLAHAVERAEATTTKIASPAYERLDPTSTSTPIIYSKPAYPAGKIRPWLQDFDYPVPYTPAMVTAQIQATYDVGLDSWLMWDPANTYTESVLEKASTTPPLGT